MAREHIRLTDLLLRIFHFILFTSIFITLCALIMVLQTNQLLHLQYNTTNYLGFVAFSTLCSYNFHWYLTPDMPSETVRISWTRQHRSLHLALFLAGLAGSTWYFFHLIQHWFWLGGAVLLTFLYSAPKLPPPFRWLQKIAVGKTIFLAFVWMYVTSFLPIAIDGHAWDLPALLFCLSRFFLVYAICIIFDYRDRAYDKQQGIRSMVTYFSDRGVDRLFYFSLLIFAAVTLGLFYFQFSPALLVVLLLPGLIVWRLYVYSKSNFSDYLYYFVLDGLMMLSSIITLLIPIQ